MSKLVCWNCGANLDDIPRPISRHASCPKCFNELHCCRLCRHYDASTSMVCFEDRADPPLQKENANFCEFFAPRFGAFEPKTAIQSEHARSNLDALFGGADNAENDPVDRDGDDGTNEARDEAPPTKEELAKKKLDDLFG